MKGSILYTTKDHTLEKREIFPSPPVPAAHRLSVSNEGTHRFLGFGVAITPSSCYELNQMEEGMRRQLLSEIYGKEGLGLSVARLCMGSSDYSPEIYSYDDVPFDTELKHFSVQKDEAYVIPMIKEILKINPDLYFFASPWSPPGWMKTGGKICGGYMRDEFVDCYADYVIKFVEAYAAHGIRISTITPQNECNTQQSGRMPACVWHPETEAKFIVLLREKCKKKGLDLNIWMYDHSFADTDRVLWQLEHCKGLKECCNGVAFHYYLSTVEQTRILAKKHPELELHFTEGGPRLNDHYDTDWCKWGVIIAKAMKVGYRSFTGWNLVLDEWGGPNVGPFLGICGGLVTFDHRTKELRYSGQYRAFSHIAPYVTPRSVIRGISAGDSFDLPVGNFPKHNIPLEGILIETPGEKSVAVIVNPNEHGIQAQIEIDGVLWYLELHGDSISTVVIDG